MQAEGNDTMLPDTIILDTYALMRDFRRLAQDLHESPEFADDVVQELIERMQDGKTAEMSLARFVGEVNVGYHMEDEDGDIDPVYAGSIINLGRAIYQQLHHIGVYRFDGFLPYHYHLPDLPHHVNDIVLSRTRELPFDDDQYLYSQAITSQS